MRLSWNEIRARAAAFAEGWQDASYEKGEAQSFYNDFFKVFGVRRRTVGRYEEHVAKLDNSHGFIDLFWPGVLIVEHKSAGRDLRKAYGRSAEYFDALPENERPRYILVSDFQTLELHDLDERATVSFPLADPHGRGRRRSRAVARPALPGARHAGGRPRGDIARFFHEYGRRKPGGANRSHDILRNLFDCAIAWGHQAEAAGNPCKGIVRYGMALGGDRFTGTPNVGLGMSETAREYRMGWRLTGRHVAVLYPAYRCGA